MPNNGYDHQKPLFHRREMVFIFTVLSSSFFGGVLYCQNLFEAGKKSEIPKVIIGTMLWQAVALKLMPHFGIHNTFIQLFLPNFIGAVVLSSIAWNYHFKYIREYNTRHVWVPLIILAVIYGIIIALNFWPTGR